MQNLDAVGADWLIDRVGAMADAIARLGPVEFNESTRYLPAGTTPRPGFIRYDLFPFMKEPLSCFDPASPVREVNMMKGVQVAYTVSLLESILLYYIGHIKTGAGMFVTADKELADGRMENNIIPMINESGLAHLIRSADEGNAKKTGKTKNYLQWDGGGFLIPNGAKNAAKMRQYSVLFMLKDELDAWDREIGKDGNSDILTDHRMSAYWELRKILRGSTPLVYPSMILDAYKRGDQRKYLVRCHSCSFPQHLKMYHGNDKNNPKGGFRWDLEKGVLDHSSVRYMCLNCGREHFEHDKEKLFSTEDGAYWSPTADPKEINVRSYHLPSFYSPFGFRPWYKCIADYLESWDVDLDKVKDYGKLQTFYNNTLGYPFKVPGTKIKFAAVSMHRRYCYNFGEIPNRYAKKHSGSVIQFLTCQIDVHDDNLAVAVHGWCRGSISYLIDYWRFEKGDEPELCSEIASPVWARVRELIEEKVYIADDGKRYRIINTAVDAGYRNDTAIGFCSDYNSGVYYLYGRESVGKGATVKEFSEITTAAGVVGYKIMVDPYKDRIAAALRREWVEENGTQRAHHFNFPTDVTTAQMREFEKEERREKTNERGVVSSVWHRLGNAPNELFDLSVYGHAFVEIMAWRICIVHFELKTIDWADFWNYVTENPYYSEANEHD